VINADRLKKASERVQKIPLELMRFTPFIGETISQFAENKLSKTNFKYLNDLEPPEVYYVQPAPAPKPQPKTVRSIRDKKWREDDEKENLEEKILKEAPTAPRLIIFIAGGVTFSEIREAYDIAEKTGRDIIICSTHTLNAEQFMLELSNM
jgi:syntaxin-binding protein 1